MCATWQLSVPATGLTDSDHFQPGSNVARIACTPPRFTTSTLPLLMFRVSSGLSKLFLIVAALCASADIFFCPPLNLILCFIFCVFAPLCETVPREGVNTLSLLLHQFKHRRSHGFDSRAQRGLRQRLE